MASHMTLAPKNLEIGQWKSLGCLRYLNQLNIGPLKCLGYMTYLNYR